MPGFARTYLFIIIGFFLYSQHASAQDLESAVSFWRQDVARTCEGHPSKENCDDGDSVLFNGLLCFMGEEAGCQAVRASQDANGQFWRSPRRNPGNLGEAHDFSRDQSMGVLAYLIKTRDVDAAERWRLFIESTRSCSHKTSRFIPCQLWNYRVCYGDDDRCILRPATWAMIKRTWEYLGLSTTHEMRRHDTMDVSDLELAAVDHQEPGYQLHLKAVQSLLRYTMRSSVSRTREIVSDLYGQDRDNLFFQYLDQGASPELTQRLLDVCPKMGDDLSFRRFQWSWERASAGQPWLESMGWDCIFMAGLLRDPGSYLSF